MLNKYVITIYEFKKNNNTFKNGLIVFKQIVKRINFFKIQHILMLI